MAPKSKRKRSRKAETVKKIAIPFEERKEDKEAPHSFVVTRGNVCKEVHAICRDFRKIMEPYTATNLKERKCNKLKDFVSLSGIFHISYMSIFTQKKDTCALRIARMPQGPTLTFNVHSFCLAKDVLSTMKSQYMDEGAFLHAPVVILNGFSGEGKHLKLMASTFQNMFPAINLSNVKLSNMKRCLLFSYSPLTKLVEIRHYYIRIQPVGINKGVKKLVNRDIPDLSRFEDVADFVTKAEILSESEGEDEDSKVTLSQDMKKGNTKENKSAIKLHELGPRLTIQLVKIEEDLLDGEVLFHEFVTKTEEEVEEIRKRREKRKKLKEQRKQEMKKNIEAKKKAKELHKRKSMGFKEEPIEDEEENGDEIFDQEEPMDHSEGEENDVEQSDEEMEEEDE